MRPHRFDHIAGAWRRPRRSLDGEAARESGDRQLGEFGDVGHPHGCGRDTPVAFPVREHQHPPPFVPCDSQEFVGTQRLRHEYSSSPTVAEPIHGVSLAESTVDVNDERAQTAW
jgi:hypothetical protein